MAVTSSGTFGAASTTTTPNTNTILAESGLSNALFGELGAAAQATGEQQALSTEAAGTQQEASQYQTAEGIAQGNAQLAGVSGQLQQYQNTRQLMNTLGSQQADIAGAGFQDSGTAVSLARSSLQQGLLQNQVAGINAQTQVGGYLEQAAASAAEAQAATTTSNTETQQAATAGNLASMDTAQAATTRNFLSQIPGVTVTTGAGGLPQIANPTPTDQATMLGGRLVSPGHPFVF